VLQAREELARAKALETKVPFPGVDRKQFLDELSFEHAANIAITNTSTREILSQKDVVIEELTLIFGNRIVNRLVEGVRLKAEVDPEWQATYDVLNRYLHNPPVVVVYSTEQLCGLLPNGTILITSGFLYDSGDITGANDLATVIAREMGHLIAQYHLEGASEKEFRALNILKSPFSHFLDLIKQSKLEEEADYIGLILMANACYDPMAPHAFWSRVAARNGSSPYSGTHPANDRAKLMKDIGATIGMKTYLESPCGCVTRIVLCRPDDSTNSATGSDRPPTGSDGPPGS